MNCLDFRRLCLVEPASREPRVYLHLYHCPACRAYRKRVLQAENELNSVMSVSVPEGLGQKIVFDAEMTSQQRHPRFIWQAIAASVVLAVTIGIGLGIARFAPDVVPTLAMHIADDPLHMSPPQFDASQRLDQVMRHLGGVWQGSKPAITHATVCLLNKRAAAHLVVAGDKGPVTVFLLPGFSARAQHDVVVDGQLAAVQRLGDGSIALFGYPGENFADIAAHFDDSIHWNHEIARLRYDLHIASK